MPIKLDELNYKILKRLKRNAQEPLSTLSKKLGTPKSTIHARIKKMEENGFIKRYTVDLDYQKLGYEIVAFIMINFDQYETEMDQEEVAEKIAKIPIIQEVHIIAGEWDMIIKAYAENINELGDLSVKYLKKIDGVGKSLTYVSLKPIKSSTDAPYVVDEID